MKLLSTMVLILVGQLLGNSAQAQQLPATELWLLDVSETSISPPRKISTTVGYNNQPMFSEDGKSVFYTSEQVDGQTDVARYYIDSGQTEWVVTSPESEYSPTPVPGRMAVSVIRVELPGQEQRLWSLPLGDGQPELLMPNVEPVGYHSWVDHESVVVFILGETFDLHFARVGPEPSKLLVQNIGRTLRLHPLNQQMLFVDKNQEPWAIAGIDPITGEWDRLVELYPGQEDFEVDAQGTYWMGYDSKLYRRAQGDDQWYLYADLSEYGIAGISRIATDKMKAHAIVLVSDKSSSK